MTDLTTLIAKLEASTGPDRELDWMVSDCFSYPHPFPESSVWPPFVKGSRTDKEIPSFTASINAAVALADRVLPGWRIQIEINRDDKSIAVVFSNDRRHKAHMIGIKGVAYNPSIALVIAILRAKQAEGKA